jgi:katanin p60 ATPase-containing subunit A1
MLQKYKADTSSRIQEQKRIEERKRNILVLLYRHLISCGYTGAAQTMTSECNIDLDKWEVADNIDLFYMVQDFEEYFEMKFLKKPVLVKRNEGPPTDIRNKKGLPPK